MDEAIERKALIALAMAYDREDAAQRGEPDPWSDPSTMLPVEISERIECAREGLAAYITMMALAADDATKCSLGPANLEIETETEHHGEKGTL